MADDRCKNQDDCLAVSWCRTNSACHKSAVTRTPPASEAHAGPTLLEYHEIAAIVAEVKAKYPGSDHVAQYAADRAQRAVLKLNAAAPSQVTANKGGMGADAEAELRLNSGEAPLGVQAAPAPKLTVWYGPMPESNGRTNWTALLMRGKEGSFTIARSEYPGRVQYEAERMRYMIGEREDEPDILAYDSEKRTPCHLCGGSGVKDGKPCWGLEFRGTVHDAALGVKGKTNG